MLYWKNILHLKFVELVPIIGGAIPTFPVYNENQFTCIRSLHNSCHLTSFLLHKSDLLVQEIDQYTHESALARSKTYKSTAR